MRFSKCFYLVLFLLGLSQSLSSQMITGKVMDSNTKEGLIAAEVIVYKDGVFVTGAITDINGIFSIDVNGGNEIEGKYIGYHSKKTTIEFNKEQAIYLELGAFIPNCSFVEIKANKITPSAFNQIEKETLDNLSPQNPQQLYNNIPGLYMHAGALNTNRITIRGIGSRSPFSTTKIKAYLNDIPLTNGIGETNLEDLNLGIIDNINIYKGPTASRHGASLGGLIHYRTVFDNDSGNTFNSDISYGSFNTISTSTGASSQLTRRSRITLNHNLLSTDGYRDNNNLLRQNYTGFYQLNSGNSVISVFANLTDVDAFIPSSLNVEDYNENPSAAAGNWAAAKGKEEYQKAQIGTSYQYESDNNWNSSITGFLTTFENDERRPFNVLNQIAINMGIRSRITKAFDLATITLGSELFKENESYATYVTLDEGQGDVLSDNYEQRKYANLFIEGDKSIKRFKVSSGVNVNFTNYLLDDKFYADSIDQSGTYNFKPIVSPRLSLSFNPRSNRIYYASLSHGFSAPTLSETLTPDGQINSDIQPETGWNAEVGYRGLIPFNTEIDVSLYYMWISNLLVAERITEDAFVGKNAGKTRHPGLEIALSKKLYLGNNGDKELSISTNYQYAPHRFQEFIDNNIDLQGNTLPGNPEQKWNASINYKCDLLDAQLTNQWVSNTFADDLNETVVDGYSVSDFNLQINIISESDWNLSLGGTIQNIFDTQYASMIAVNPRSFGSNLPRYLYPGLPRNYMMRVKASYHWK